MKYIYVSIISLQVMFHSCSPENTAELYNNATIEAEMANIFADSMSSTKLLISFGEETLPRSQNIRITTSHGGLHTLPFTAASPAKDTVTLKPNSEQIGVILFANTLDPVNEVYVTVTINDFSFAEVVSFTPAPPEDFMLMADSIFVSSDSNPIITGELYRSSGKSSNDIRFDITSAVIKQDTSQLELLTHIPEYVFSKSNKITIPINIVQHSSGSQLEVTVSTKNPSDQVIEKSITIRFK